MHIEQVQGEWEADSVSPQLLVSAERGKTGSGIRANPDPTQPGTALGAALAGPW